MLTSFVTTKHFQHCIKKGALNSFPPTDYSLLRSGELVTALHFKVSLHVRLCPFLQPGRWPQHGKNVETVGQLWLGLLQFYTEVFDFREHVISIRQLAPLTTFNKQWTSKYIVIEGGSPAASSQICGWMLIP